VCQSFVLDGFCLRSLEPLASAAPNTERGAAQTSQEQGPESGAGVGAAGPRPPEVGGIWGGLSAREWFPGHPARSAGACLCPGGQDAQAPPSRRPTTRGDPRSLGTDGVRLGIPEGAWLCAFDTCQPMGPWPPCPELTVRRSFHVCQ
jgi:hypothetical protein